MANKILPKFKLSEVLSRITAQNIISELQNLSTNSTDYIGYFIMKQANKWMNEAKNRPIPTMLFSEFWFEQEVCFLFGDTNCGKTALAVQIAESIASGRAIEDFKMQASAQMVLFLDFELSDKQFEGRYSNNFTNHYRFSDNLLRIEINPDAELPENATSETFLRLSIEQAIIKTRAKILIVDNITYLRNRIEKAQEATPLMQDLKKLKNQYDLSILVLAHTPKRDMSKPLSRNDLAGSKSLINFCNSAFTIGESSQEKTIRYLKQIKARNTEIIYDSDNIRLCQLVKPENFLLFEFYGYGREKDHLKSYSDKELSELEFKVLEFKKADPNITQTAIAEKLEINKMRVSRILKKHSSNSEPEKDD